MLKHVLSPVLKKMKYKPIRADQIPKAGLITTQIINLIIESPLVIADLTGGNPNVFYELAIRHATRKPYIQIIAKGEKIPFDIGSVRTVEVDHGDLDSVEEAKSQIISWIKEFDKGHIPDSPISVASSTRLLQEDDELAEKIAEKLAYLPDMFATPYVEPDYDVTEMMENLTTRGVYSIEDIDRKLDKILQEIKKSSSD